MPDIKSLIAQRNVLSNEAIHYIEGYLIYLRKSRQDDPNETVEEVLSKHELQLQEYALRELGGLIPEDNIYREVVSGESIDDREEIQKVLSRIEGDEITGVLVVEPSRLSRGDLGDCDRIIKSFLYTDTLVYTLRMTYDMKNKMERKFFQQELLMSNDFLEYTKDILWRGRMAAAKRGCYIPTHPPYGYDKVRIGKDATLVPNEDADIVRMMFDWYVKGGVSPNEIARRLNEMSIPSPWERTQTKGRVNEGWLGSTIRKMLLNPHYIGKIRFNERKQTTSIEYGERVKRWVMQPEEEVVLVEGKHPGIVDPEIFEAARVRLDNNPRPRLEYGLQNVLAGVAHCKKCGNLLTRDPRRQRGRNAVPRIGCVRRNPRCYKSAKYDDVVDAVITTLEQVELPKLQLKLENGEGNAATIQKTRINKLVKQMSELREQEDKQYELLETGVYTQEVFDRRNRALREKIEECEKELHVARKAMPKNVDYGEKIKALEDAITAMRDPDMPIEEQNRLLRAIVERIDYSSVDLGFNKTEVHLEVYLRL